MIKINEIIIDQKTFPDGTLLVKFDPFIVFASHLTIKWKYENDAELWTVYALTRHLQEKGYKVNLVISYCPNSRQDRTKHREDVFTLKWFAEIINSLDFVNVYTFDMHSDVGLALFDRLVHVTPEDFIEEVIDMIDEENKFEDNENLVLYYPDNGAAKKYSSLMPEFKYVYGIKKRNWENGQILGLDVITNGIDLNDKTILMVDDLCSFGGSLYYSSLKLKELGAKKIYAYTSHTENSLLDKERGTLIKALEDGTVERLYTTDSLFTGEHEKVTVMEVM